MNMCLSIYICKCKGIDGERKELLCEWMTFVLYSLGRLLLIRSCCLMKPLRLTLLVSYAAVVV